MSESVAGGSGTAAPIEVRLRDKIAGLERKLRRMEGDYDKATAGLSTGAAEERLELSTTVPSPPSREEVEYWKRDIEETRKAIEEHRSALKKAEEEAGQKRAEAARQADADLKEWSAQNQGRAEEENSRKAAEDEQRGEEKNREIAAHGERTYAQREEFADRQAALLEHWAREDERRRADAAEKERKRAEELAALTRPSPEETAAKSHPSESYGKILHKRHEKTSLEGTVKASSGLIAMRVASAQKKGGHGVDAALANSEYAKYLKHQEDLAAVERELQSLPQDELAANPREFLQHIILSTDFNQGIQALYPGIPANLRGEFINAMGRWDRHWFKLAPDTAREARGFPAFTLTPAIERYLEGFPDDAVISRVRQGSQLPSTPSSSIPAAYVPYRTGRPDVGDFAGTIGNADVRRDPAPGDRESAPDFVFTPGMNGCAFTVTPSKDADPGKFTAWHFQSPGSNKRQAERFRAEKKPSDWFGDDEYESPNQQGLYETANLLWRGPDGWRVFSQETRYSAFDRNDVHGMKFSERPWNVPRRT
ncbi:hypothetical protein ABZ611_29885 [Streptomyces sp. NPDC007861]|uniref:hypothetical protein n=1 Tax=Streptomyces sp. NPDC007861 TaxID=3154893 RepID=UPI0033DB224F